MTSMGLMAEVRAVDDRRVESHRWSCRPTCGASGDRETEEAGSCPNRRLMEVYGEREWPSRLGLPRY